MRRSSRATQAQLNYEESSDSDISDSKFDKYRDLSKRKMKSYGYHDLETLLEAECPGEFQLIPNITRTITFLSTTAVPGRLPFVPTCGTHLHFGNIESPILENRDSVFIYIGGEGNNRIGLVGGEDNRKIELAQAVLVNPAKPFWYLCSHGRVIDGAEMKRLRALACFFLAGAHVPTVQHYPEFNEDLIDAIVWYGRGLEAETRDSSSKAGPIDEISKASNTTALTSKQRNGESYLGCSVSHDLPVRAVSEQSNATVGVEHHRKYSPACCTGLSYVDMR
jgi:hypothetical protein